MSGSELLADDPHRSTPQWLALRARRQPERVAIFGGDTYYSLALNVLRMTDALTAMGLRGGQVLGVETADRFLHLLILLAAETLSITTISLFTAELESLEWMCDRIVSSDPDASYRPAKVFVMTREWVGTLFSQPMDFSRVHELEHQPSPDAIARLIKSSGTTGVPKVMSLSYRVLQLRTDRFQINMPPSIRQNLNYLCLYHFTVSGSHVRALLTLRLGGTIHLIGGEALWSKILSGAGNYLVFMTGDLPRFVRSAPPDRGPFELQIDANGSAVSPRLRQEIRERITRHMTVVYGSNECGRIGFVDDDNVSALVADVRVKVVDERGEPVPLGQPGRIRISTDAMTGGYLGAPELTRAVFVDGWQHTDDIGFQPAEGKLVLLGRADDMLNVGGIKVAPGPIEERLKEIDGILDALVTSIDDNLETAVILVALETRLDADLSRLEQLITPVMVDYAAEFRLIALSAFPRTESGKIRRNEIRSLYRR
jgi:acyl-coenzyme A synthetase/AMP-(fatty) acid ligase